jgi:hypothetical protein
LGEVTLGSIFDCVLRHGARRFPRFEGLKLTGTTVRFAGDVAGEASAAALREELREVLIELLSGLGALTGEILTPSLHVELAKVSLAERGEVGYRVPRRLAARA